MSLFFFLSVAAASYEIRCYTSRDALTESKFSEMGILVHASFTPTPLDYGQLQTCTVGVPWPNEVFYYALVAFDAAGNRSPISNVISVYIYEAPTTTTTSTSPSPNNLSNDLSNESFLQLSNYVSLSSDGVIVDVREKSSHTKVYIATGVVCGLLILIIAVIAIILVRVRTKRSQYNAEARDSYRAYEPTPPTGGQTKGVASPGSKGVHVHHPELSNTSKNLSNWLDSLPRSEAGHSPNTTAHDISISNSADLGGTLNRRSSSNTHTLTKTNPYRHKVLTNGSFLNLNIKESPTNSGGPVTNSGLVSSSGVSSGGSDNGSNSSRPTTSTEDNNSESESSNKGVGVVNTASVVSLRRSNTTLSTTNRQVLPAEETVLPPPDAFSNTTANRGKVNYSTIGRYPIDTSTAKAIIDTYSGNLFSRSNNYLSFRDRDQVIRSNSTVVSPDRLLNQNYPSAMDADSLEVYPVTPNVYSPSTFNNNVDNWDGQGLSTQARNQSKKTRRTESVV